jgi:hypothetical protein
VKWLRYNTPELKKTTIMPSPLASQIGSLSLCLSKSIYFDYTGWKSLQRDKQVGDILLIPVIWDSMLLVICCISFRRL